MEAFDFDNVVSSSSSSSPEKSTANLLLYAHHFKSITKLFRIVEVCLGLFFLSWTSSYLPFAFKISGEYFRLLVTIIISPLFIFLLGNLIVVTLLFKAGHVLSAGRSSTVVSSETDLYEEFIKTSNNCTKFTNLIPSTPDEIEYEDKRTIFEVSGTVDKIAQSDVDALEVADTEVPDKLPFGMKAYSRTLSENLESRTENVEEEEITDGGKLRRSETMKCRKVGNPGEIPAETVYVFDELSNEEFQQTIEAFIAKQINFHREEKLAIVSS